MNKEDKHEYILTFPAYLKDFILDLWPTPNGLLQIPGKNDESSSILHSSFMHTVESSICVSTRTANQKLSLAMLGSDIFNVSTTYGSHSPVLRFSCLMMMLWLCFAK